MTTWIKSIHCLTVLSVLWTAVSLGLYAYSNLLPASTVANSALPAQQCLGFFALVLWWQLCSWLLILLFP